MGSSTRNSFTTNSATPSYQDPSTPAVENFDVPASINPTTPGFPSTPGFTSTPGFPTTPGYGVTPANPTTPGFGVTPGFGTTPGLSETPYVSNYSATPNISTPGYGVNFSDFSRSGIFFFKG